MPAKAGIQAVEDSDSFKDLDSRFREILCLKKERQVSSFRL
jgi:hypothetical protein